MNAEELKSLAKQFAIDVGRLTQLLPENRINNAYCNQIVRSSSSVDANYRAARRAKSTADHINKLKIVEEELTRVYIFWNCYWFSTLHSKKKLTSFTKQESRY